ncbi:hypothetical protein [Bartonella rattimassiliensis]|nr:hypothetical protein [Bartonella rattimassiliensis]
MFFTFGKMGEYTFASSILFGATIVTSALMISMALTTSFYLVVLIYFAAGIMNALMMVLILLWSCSIIIITGGLLLRFMQVEKMLFFWVMNMYYNALQSISCFGGPRLSRVWGFTFMGTILFCYAVSQAFA